MVHKPHEHYPLLAFGLAAAPLSIMGVMQTGNYFALEFAAMVAIFGSCALVLGIVAHWRHG